MARSPRPSAWHGHRGRRRGVVTAAVGVASSAIIGRMATLSRPEVEHVAYLARLGLTDEEAKFHPERSVLYRALGTNPTAEVETQEPMVLSSNETFVLCSDGLSNLVEDEEIQRIVSSMEPQDACDELVRRANEQGGYDNITVAIVHVKVKDSFVERMMS